MDNIVKLIDRFAPPLIWGAVVGALEEADTLSTGLPSPWGAVAAILIASALTEAKKRLPDD